MSRNGSGTYSLPAGNPVVSGTTISSTTHNNTMSDIATALTNSLAKNGETTPTANLPMGGYKLTGLAAGTTAGDSVRYEQFASPPDIGGTAAASGTFTTLTSTGNAALGDAEATDTHAIKGATTLLANSASDALKITQTGSGNSLLIEDSASTDSTPGVVDALGSLTVGDTAAIAMASGSPKAQFVQVSGTVVVGGRGYAASTAATILELAKSRQDTVGHTIVQSGDDIGSIRFSGSDGTNFVRCAQITASSDGTPGTNDMPGRLLFLTTKDGAQIPTEAFRIDSNQFSQVKGSFGKGAPVKKTADFTVALTENNLINNKSGSTCTVTLPSASTFSGREILIKTIQAQTVVSASSDVVPIAGGAAGTAILAATAGKWALLVSNGTNWEIMAQG